MPMSRKQEQLEAFIEETLSETPFDIVMVEYKKAGKDWYLRVFIDCEGGVNLSHCEQATHLLLDRLEVSDPLGGDYQLEVSSPGVDRPLVKPRDFARFVGQRVSVSLHRPQEGHKVFTGELAAFSEASGILEVIQEADGVTYQIPLDTVAKATLKPELKF